MTPESEQLRFDRRVAIVTGAGRGIGRAHAHQLAARGAAVVVSDLGTAMDGTGQDAHLARVVAKEIVEAGGRAIADVGDVSDPDDAERLVSRAVGEFGGLDIVVNNAGIVDFRELLATDLSHLRRHLAVHVEGSFNVTRAAWPQLVKGQYGRVVMTTSVALYGSHSDASYGSAKGGVYALARSLAVEGEAHGIAVNVVSPSAQTRMSGAVVRRSVELDQGVPPTQAPEMQERRKPENVAALIVWLTHETCPVSGAAYSAGWGRVARIFLAETDGYTEADITPESIRDHWTEINDMSSFIVPRNARDWMELHAALVRRSS